MRLWRLRTDFNTIRHRKCLCSVHAKIVVTPRLGRRPRAVTPYETSFTVFIAVLILATCGGWTIGAQRGCETTGGRLGIILKTVTPAWPSNTPCPMPTMSLCLNLIIAGQILMSRWPRRRWSNFAITPAIWRPRHRRNYRSSTPSAIRRSGRVLSLCWRFHGRAAPQ